MSVSASIDIKLAVTDGLKGFILNIIKLLLTYGWSFNDDNLTFYLPIGDDDDFEWQRDDISEDKLLRLLGKKEELGELVGVAMTWRDTSIGGEFLFREDGSISINLSIHRKKIEIQDFTDVNWYLERLIPAMKQGQLSIESISFSEHK